MYNSIYPININYRKNPYQAPASNSNAQKDKGFTQASAGKDSYIPSSNKINISQILMDFKNTIVAINAPKEVQDEVNIYLDLVDRESKKETPSKDIIFSNLKNASIISDDYITVALGKKSNVVEGWVSTFFRQDINLKANPDEINPDFLLRFPSKEENKEEVIVKDIDKPKEETPVEIKEEESKPEEISSEIKITDAEDDKEKDNIEIDSTLDTISDSENIFIEKQEPNTSPFAPFNQSDEKAKILYAQAKRIANSDEDSSSALSMLNDALGYLSEDSNSNIKAAIHFERAKIFDKYDYVDYALRDYFEATKADDLNLKANAYYKTGSIYDEFKEFSPALDNYLSSVAYLGEAENLSAQSKVLSKISSMYTRAYDIQNAQSYADLAMDSAISSENDRTIAQTYSSIADNYSYLGENQQALDNYKNALMVFSKTDEDNKQKAYNYSQAAKVMYELGNKAKASKLQAKADLYLRKAQLEQSRQEQAA